MIDVEGFSLLWTGSLGVFMKGSSAGHEEQAERRVPLWPLPQLQPQGPALASHNDELQSVCQTKAFLSHVAFHQFFFTLENQTRTVVKGDCEPLHPPLDSS